MLKEIRPALLAFLALTFLTGFVYPLAVTAFAQLFPLQAGGDPALIGQAFSDPKYFWSRPSATSPQPYNGASSSGSNQGPTNKALAEAVADRVKALREADAGNTKPVPADLVTASASGLDPHISPQAAEYQVRAWRACASSTRASCASWSARTPRGAPSACSAIRG